MKKQSMDTRATLPSFSMDIEDSKGHYHHTQGEAQHSSLNLSQETDGQKLNQEQLVSIIKDLKARYGHLNQN